VFDILREKPRTAVVVLFLPALITTIYLIATINLTLQENDGYLGAVLDDTWIHVRFAHHIAQGEGLSYNEGVLTTGATSPLWVLALGAVRELRARPLRVAVRPGVGPVLVPGAGAPRPRCW